MVHPPVEQPLEQLGQQIARFVARRARQRPGHGLVVGIGVRQNRRVFRPRGVVLGAEQDANFRRAVKLPLERRQPVLNIGAEGHLLARPDGALKDCEAH